MKEHALTVDAREAKGLHDGSITCLVRVIDPQPVFTREIEIKGVPTRLYSWGDFGLPGCDMRIRDIVAWAPFGGVGDRLWIQEDWFAFTGHGCIQLGYPAVEGRCQIGYRAAMKDSFDAAYRRAHTMPRFAARTLLDVTDVRVVRVQDVTEEDAKAAGIHVLPLQDADDPSAWWESSPGQHQARTPVGAFRKMHAAKSIGDVVNPWLWLATVAKVNPERKPEKSE